ncbi:MAG: sensor histidine kinase [Oscillospiraceae bacterium]|nr:sensor histidine kinase [Oscillospiraceae bacterium]
MRELSLNVMDIAQNSIRAGAALTTIRVDESVPGETLSITIADNGCGMSEEQVKSVIDPFFTTRTTRKVGLGVPLFKMEAEMTGGSFNIDSTLGVGTTLTAVFKTSHVDMIPLGEIGAVMHLLITCNPEIDFLYIRNKVNAAGEEKTLTLDTREFRAQLGDVPFSEPDVAEWIKEYIAEMESELEF